MKRRKAKIVCTLGPASARRDVLFTLIREGMDVARLNFSHGSHEFHRETVKLIREGEQKFDRPVTILQDLQGIKIRVGGVKNGAVKITRGAEVSLFPGEGTGDEKNIFVSYPLLLKDARKGDTVLIDDGLIQMEVTGKGRKALKARVVEGGVLTDKKGVNFPGMRISQESFTPKDRKDLAFGLDLGVDYVAVSFVGRAADITSVRDWLKEKKEDIPLIAKIEKREALDNIGSILDASDGVMVARGDLGVEVPTEEVPLIQKDLIGRANRKGKLVITATQMLESMKEHLRPTRAEATDVANAVIDGTDALMLSVETATGAYPVAAFRMMDRIIRHTERTQTIASSYERGNSYAEAIADAARGAAVDIGARVLVAFTKSGFTAGLVSKFRPEVPIIAFTPDRRVMSRLPFYWGVIPKFMKPLEHTDQLVREVEKVLVAEKIARKNDRIVLIASSPLSTTGKTNFMKLYQIGE